MNWEELKEIVYYEDGSLRDIFIQNTTREDWTKWIDFVNNNFSIEYQDNLSDAIDYQDTLSDAILDKINSNRILNKWEGEELWARAIIYLDNISINVYFFTEFEFDSDILPEAFHSLNHHKKLVEYLINISKVLEKTVFLCAESVGTPKEILIKVEHDLVVIYKNGEPIS